MKNISEDGNYGFMCNIDGYISESSEYVIQGITNIVNRICKYLTFEVNKFNCNKHRFQPRVEPCWDKVKYRKNEYKPWVDFFNNKYRNTSYEIVLNDTLKIHESLYMKAITSIDTNSINYIGWLNESNSSVEFMIDEYYYALGKECVTSKFFHLFTIIEHIEHEYKEHAGANLLFTEEEKKDVISAVKNMIYNDTNHSNRLEKLVSKIGQFMTDTTNIGRIDKLRNIINWLGIDKLQIINKEVAITNKFLNEIVKLRNKSFHGLRDEKDIYRKEVVNLFYLCEKIIEAVEKRENEK